MVWQRTQCIGVGYVTRKNGFWTLIMQVSVFMESTLILRYLPISELTPPPLMIYADAWMIKNMDLSPRGTKQTSNICLMPADSNGVQRSAAAFVLDAPRDVANYQPDWITFCDGAWSILKYQMHQYLDQASVTKLHTQKSWIQSVIYNTWERLLAHELFHGKAAFGEYAGGECCAIWPSTLLLAC